MYSIKPWGRAALVGNTVGTTCLGVGMRWRETVVDLIDTHAAPASERDMHRRCVISRNAVRLMSDIGVTEEILLRELRPAGTWKFVTQDLELLKEGNTYPGCAPTEAVFHIPYGRLLRTLRREFLRFGGQVYWETRAFEPHAQPDTTGFWCLRKEFGTLAELEACVSGARSHKEAHAALFGEKASADIPEAKFNIERGIAAEYSDVIKGLFAKETDFAMVLGRQYVLHMWAPDGPLDRPLDAFPYKPRVAWRLTSFADVDIQPGIESLHPTVRQMMATSTNVVHDTISLPTGAPAVLEEAKNARCTLIGNALLPVDPFEWRGDDALVAIEDAANLCQRLYKPRYHRGFTPVDMREFEQDAMAKRMQLLQRDFRDADAFLNAFGELPRKDPKAEEKREIDE